MNLLSKIGLWWYTLPNRFFGIFGYVKGQMECNSGNHKWEEPVFNKANRIYKWERTCNRCGKRQKSEYSDLESFWRNA